MTIRPATQEALDLLWDFLAAYEPDAVVAKAVPFVAGHLEGWRRQTDFGFVADVDSVPAGAAWAPQFGREGNPFYLGHGFPEIIVAVRDGARGSGIGEGLVRALIAEAAGRGVRLSLNVRETNPAIRLYERLGFRCVPGQEVLNRVGTLSLGMVFTGS